MDYEVIGHNTKLTPTMQSNRLHCEKSKRRTMLLTNNTSSAPDYRADWPEHYFEIKDIDQREALLREELAQHHRPEDERRLELLQHRYPSGSYTKQGRTDAFIAAWMMLLIDGRAPVYFFNKKRLNREIRSHLRTLCIPVPESGASSGASGSSSPDESSPFIPDPVLLEEWRDFSVLWLTTCIQDKTYHSLAFGMFSMSDQRLAQKIAREIHEVTCLIPGRFGLAELVKPFHEVMRHAYCTMIENGTALWKAAVPEDDC